MTAYRILYHHRIRADDGQAVHVRELIGALRGLGHEVEEVALVPKASASPAGAMRGSKATSPWQRLSLPRFALEALEVGYSYQGARRLTAAGRAFRPDFVYERHALHCEVGLRASRVLGVPLLLEVNSPMCDEMQQLGLLRFPHRARRSEHAVLSGADRVFAVTGVLRRMMIERGADPARTIVVGNAADPARYDAAARAAARTLRSELGIGDDQFVFGFVGYLRAWHRLDRAVEALREVGLERARVLIVGTGPALDAVLAAARTHGVMDRVHALGELDPARVPAAVCAFDAALIPAINEYASPLKLFDSLAAGVPTIAPRQDNLAEVVEHGVNGVLYDLGRSTGLAAAMRELAGDPIRARALGAAGLQSLLDADWTWRGNANRVVRAYESLFEKPQTMRSRVSR